MEMFLRIAPELYLKRLVVGGFERVFEINRNFRNEGISRPPQPRVHDDGVLRGLLDYQDLMDFTEAAAAPRRAQATGSRRAELRRAREVRPRQALRSG
jgi:lysyl-tRNA synthetase class 2